MKLSNLVTRLKQEQIISDDKEITSLLRYSDNWFAVAKHRKADVSDELLVRLAGALKLRQRSDLARELLSEAADRQAQAIEQIDMLIQLAKPRP